MKRAALRRKLVRAFVALAAALALAELAWRAFELGPARTASRRTLPTDARPFVRSPEGLLVYAPGAEWSFVYDVSALPESHLGRSGSVSFRINALGLRGRERTLAKPAENLRVLCLGDSFTFGEGVRVEDAYPARLEQRLNEALSPRPVEVWNAGVQGYGTVEALGLLSTRLLAARPEVVTLGFFLNDATDFERTIAEFTAGLESAPLSGIARWSRIAEAVERARRAAELRRRFVESTRASFRSDGWTRCKAAFVAMRELAGRQDFRLLVVIFPALIGLDGEYPFEVEHVLVVQALEQAGCESLDLLSAFRGLDARDLWVHPSDHHPNPRAHAIAAERIAERLLAER